MLRKLGNSRPLVIAFMGRGNVYGKISAVPLMILSSEVYDEDWPPLKKLKHPRVKKICKIYLRQFGNQNKKVTYFRFNTLLYMVKVQCTGDNTHKVRAFNIW